MLFSKRKSPRCQPWKLALIAALASFGLSQARTMAQAEQAKPAKNDPNEQARNEVSTLWDVNQLMERAADNIARRYNLNDTQRQQTREMLNREVTKFLDEHTEIWPLVRDLARLQKAGETPTGKVGERLAEKATPLLRDIEDTIVEANLRWREILTEEQKRMHDFDLQDMSKTFAKMNDNFRNMASGGPAVAEVFPRPNSDARPPKRPPQPPKDFTPPPPSPVQGEQSTTNMWDRYVENFIRDYKLDDQQSEAARSVLKECKQRAEDYRHSKRSEFAQVQEHLRDANRPERSPEARASMLRVATKVQRSLNKPILDLFLELQNRLEPIPTEAQRAHARKLGRDTGPQARSREAAPTEPAAPEPAALNTSGQDAVLPEPVQEQTPPSAEQPKATSAPQTSETAPAKKAEPPADNAKPKTAETPAPPPADAAPPE